MMSKNSNLEEGIDRRQGFTSVGEKVPGSEWSKLSPGSGLKAISAHPGPGSAQNPTLYIEALLPFLSFTGTPNLSISIATAG
jgi:hypothetical protein